jgi:hypothetical protein
LKHIDFTFKTEKGTDMLYGIAVILVVSWLLAIVTSQITGGFIHVLLAIAVVAILYRIITGRLKARVKV